MKTWIVVSTLFLASLARAQVIADVFECSTKIVDIETGSSAESVSQAIGRRAVTPVNSATGEPYAADMQVTRAEVPFSVRRQNQDMLYQIDFTLRYAFATRSRSNSVEARQTVCNAVSVSVCKTGSCSASVSACVEPANPFDANFGWSETALFNGVPIFNEKLLRPIDETVSLDERSPGQRITVSCKFKGTFF